MISKFVFSFMASVCLVTLSIAGPLTPEEKEKVTAKLEQLKLLGTDATVVAEVKALTANPPLPGMTNEKWKSATVIGPEVKTLSKNTLATYLKSKKDDAISEMFVSDSAGNKVALFAKTTSFCHKGKPKHDIPMTGKTWIGEIEVDESTGVQQVQVSFPVLDGKKPIGSIVAGLSIEKL
jgi:hypothetical protein